MSNKDFKKGMEAGARPFEEKFKILGEENQENLKRITDELSNIDEVMDVLIDKRSADDRKRLYDLNTIADIANLDNSEREFLLASLYTLGNSMEEVNELQQKFIRTVKTYLDISIPQEDIEIRSIENIKHLTTQKAILQTIMEFLFLGCENHQYLDKYEEEFFSYFSVNKRSLDDIKEKIDTICKVAGLEGITEKYGYVVEEEFEVSLDKDKPEEVEEVEKEDLILSSILKIGKEDAKVIEDKNVYIDTYINCEGQLTFTNCTIYYNEPDSINEILLSEGANLLVENCDIICKDRNKEFFIKGKGSNKMIFQGCNFYDSTKLVRISGDQSELIIEACNIINPGEEFLDASYIKRGHINESYIKISMDKKDSESRFFGNSYIFGGGVRDIFDEKCEFIVEDCIVYADELVVDTVNESDGMFDQIFCGGQNIFSINGASYKNCTFENLSNCIYDSSSISQSEFHNCFEPVNLGFNYYGSKRKIENCLFRKCKDVMEVEDVDIKHCQFIECSNSIINANKSVDIEFCEFYNLLDKRKTDYRDTALLMLRKSKKELGSTIKRCIFDGIDIKENFLIAANVYEKVDGYVVSISDSSFRNCKTGRKSGKIISEYDSYVGLFNKWVEVKTSNISNCTGLDKVNKENGYVEDVIIKSESTTGVKIGSRILGNIIGGITLGGPGMILSELGGRKYVEKMFIDDDIHDE